MASNRPDRTEVRAWLLLRQRTGAPPPGIDEVRRALGWTANGPVPLVQEGAALSNGQKLNTAAPY